MVFVNYRVGVGGVAIVKVLSPHIVVSACAAVEQIGYFSAFKLFGCSRNAKIVFTAAVCQIVAVGLGATSAANAADRSGSTGTRNRPSIVAVGLGAIPAANAANIIGTTRNRSCVVAVGLGATIAANAADILSTRNRSSIVAVGYSAIAAANAADIIART